MNAQMLLEIALDSGPEVGLRQQMELCNPTLNFRQIGMRIPYTYKL